MARDTVKNVSPAEETPSKDKQKTKEENEESRLLKPSSTCRGIYLNILACAYYRYVSIPYLNVPQISVPNQFEGIGNSLLWHSKYHSTLADLDVCDWDPQLIFMETPQKQTMYANISKAKSSPETESRKKLQIRCRNPIRVIHIWCKPFAVEKTMQRIRTRTSKKKKRLKKKHPRKV